MNVAVILAGGKGKRLGTDVPKQFLKIAGKTVIEWSLEAFQENSNIDEISVVVADDYQELMSELVFENYEKWTKLKYVLSGGTERCYSTLSALKAYKGTVCNIIFHDAARPLVSQDIINNVATALMQHKAVSVAIDATDTIVQTDDGSFISNILKRSQLRCMQTPQAFDNELINKAYSIAINDKQFEATDDCGVVAKYLPNEKIFIVKGEVTNIKITYNDDILTAERLLNAKTKTKK